MGLEILLFGGAILWFVALIPAAFVCIRHQEWAGFFAGWLIFGLGWIVCAATFIPRRYAARALILIGLSLIVLGAVAARPIPIMGLDGSSLESSVDGWVDLQSAPCEQLKAGSWRCGLYEAEFSSNVPYRVEVDRLGCWEARRELRDWALGRVRYSGCVSILDKLL